jgi:long-subunit acyl-CoA synthetase (AMP-forming)
MNTDRVYGQWWHTQVWDILKKGVEDQISKGSPLIKFLFQTAFSARAAAVSQGRESPLLKMIFKRVRTCACVRVLG